MTATVASQAATAGSAGGLGGRSPVQHRLGPPEQIPYGEGRTFEIDGEQVVVFRLRDGRLRALDAVCPHKGGPLADGTIDNSIVVCPLHQNAFELDTGCSPTGAPPVKTYAVSVDADEIVVTL